MSNYEKELEEMKHMSRQEYVASLRRHVWSKYIVPFSNFKSSRLQMDSHRIYPVVQEKQWIFSWCVDLPRGYKVEHIVFPYYNLVLARKIHIVVSMGIFMLHVDHEYICTNNLNNVLFTIRSVCSFDCCWWLQSLIIYSLIAVVSKINVFLQCWHVNVFSNFQAYM